MKGRRLSIGRGREELSCKRKRDIYLAVMKKEEGRRIDEIDMIHEDQRT